MEHDMRKSLEAPASMPIQIETLQKSVADLHSVIGDLNARLEPVMRPEAPTPVNGTVGTATPREPICPLACTVESSRQGVQEARARLSHILRRLDV